MSAIQSRQARISGAPSGRQTAEQQQGGALWEIARKTRTGTMPAFTHVVLSDLECSCAAVHCGGRQVEPGCSSTPGHMQVTAQLFRPPIFDPRKVTTTFLPGASGTEPQPPAPRRYTLTHNDITGQLNLSIGCNYNTVQVSGWYTRLIR